VLPVSYRGSYPTCWSAPPTCSSKTWLAMVERLEVQLKRDPERARATLADIFGERVTLEPDESGHYLWAEYGLGAVPMLAQAVGW